MECMSWKDFLTIVAPLVLSVVSIGIAIWSSRSTSKDANRQIEKLKHLVEKQSEEIEQIKNLSSLLVKSDIENLNIEILRLKTELTGVDIEIKMWDEYFTKYKFAYDHPTPRDFEHQKLLKEKKVLIENQINALLERKEKLQKGGLA